MGIEHLQKIGRRIKVARDKALAALAVGNLFTRRVALPSTHELLRLMPDHMVAVGDDVQIELNGGRVVAVKGEVLIGEIDDPMPGLVEMLAEYGIVGGRIDEVLEGARVADVEILE
jgi:hypothetical protein